ncbi:MAG TPA: uracil-DNA glycosylase [Gemmatimonadales bacterium]
MVDPRRAWLALQRDLGGDEVIFDQPVDVAGVFTPSAVAPAASSPSAVSAPRDTPPGRASAPAPAVVAAAKADQMTAGEPVGDTSWRKNLPPIPGRGLDLQPPAGGAWQSLEEIAELVRACTRCPLCTTRTNAVPGEGNPRARLMVIGEGPGDTEDKTGRPFVGRAGELLDKMLLAIEVPRADVFIANVVKCRPPQNRVPLPDEREACLPYLRRQIELVAPAVILALGGTAAEALLGVRKPLGDLRLRVHRWGDIPLIVTYHPAALLRNPNWKRPAWDDVRIARQLLDHA